MAERKSLDRRQLLAAAGLAAGAVALEAGAQAAPAAAKIAWDHEADLVCVGSGGAAMSAAITAVDRGATAIIVEKQPALGGTTQKSGGVLWVPNNFAQRAKGVDDKREDFLRYVMRHGYPQRYTPDSPTLGVDEVHYKQMGAYYDHLAPWIDRIQELGIIKFRQFAMLDLETQAPDYADHLPENKTPYGRCIDPSTGAEVLYQGGSVLIKMFAKWLESKNVPMLTGHRVTRVIKEGDRVVGVEAMAGDKVVRIKGRKGVLFGTGGYSANAELCERHQIALYGACAKSGSTGDFIAIAQDAGAAMGAMHTAWRTQVLVEEALQNRSLGIGTFFLPGDSMLVVNKYGVRCVNEKRGYNERTHAHFFYDPTREEYTNHLMFLIVDQRTMDRCAGIFPYPEDKRDTRFQATGATLDELAASIARRLEGIADKVGGVKLDPQFLAETKKSIGRYNGYAKAGVDPEFERGLHDYDRVWDLAWAPRANDPKEQKNPYPNRTMHPLSPKGPYYAYILAAGAVDTNSGPRINEKAQVLDPWGKPIPGLYGAGNCIECPTREAYAAGGITIGLAVAFGHIGALDAIGAKAA